jgi:DNA-binding response OmpR family regulator
MAGERIMIVEDEFLIRATLVEVLEDEGYEVIAAESGEEALDLLRSDGGIALMMTDMQLGGGMDGLTLASAARGVRGGLPVIFMTGRPDRVPSLDPMIEAMVSKPYTSSEVTAAITRLLAPARAADRETS